MQPLLADLAHVVDQVRLGAALARHLDEPYGVGGVARADHQQQIAARRHLLDGGLAVGGGVADVVGARSHDGGEALAQPREDRARFVHCERGLRDVGDALRVLDLEAVDVLGALHEHDPLGRLAHRAFDLLVTVVADEHDRVALLREAHRLAVHLRDQRAGRVDRVQAALARARAHARSDAVRGEHAHGSLGHLRVLLDEDRAALVQLLDHVPVVDDLLAHVHGRAVDAQRVFDRLNRPVDPRAVAAWRRQHELLYGVPHSRHCSWQPGTLSGDGPATPRPPDRRRRVLPAPGGAGVAHAHRRRHDR